MNQPQAVPLPTTPHTSGVLVMAPGVPAPGRVVLLVGCASDELGAEVTVAARQERRG
jgi:hypothetical protein